MSSLDDHNEEARLMGRPEESLEEFLRNRCRHYPNLEFDIEDDEAFAEALSKARSVAERLVEAGWYQVSSKYRTLEYDGDHKIDLDFLTFHTFKLLGGMTYAEKMEREHRIRVELLTNEQNDELRKISGVVRAAVAWVADESDERAQALREAVSKLKGA